MYEVVVYCPSSIQNVESGLATSSVAGAQAALADTVTLSYNGVGMAKTVRYWGGPVSNIHVYSGQLKHTATNGPASISGAFRTFCIEINQQVLGSGQTATYNIVDLSEAPNPGLPGSGDTFSTTVVDRIHAVLRAAMNLDWIDGKLQGDTGSTNITQAAIQLAIWESIWENQNTTVASLTLASGDSRATIDSESAAVHNALGTLFAAASALMLQNGNDYHIDGLKALTNSTYQDQLVVVPLPPAAWAGLGLLGLTFGVHRLRKA